MPALSAVEDRLTVVGVDEEGVSTESTGDVFRFLGDAVGSVKIRPLTERASHSAEHGAAKKRCDRSFFVLKPSGGRCRRNVRFLVPRTADASVDEQMEQETPVQIARTFDKSNSASEKVIKLAESAAAKQESKILSVEPVFDICVITSGYFRRDFVVFQ